MRLWKAPETCRKRPVGAFRSPPPPRAARTVHTESCAVSPQRLYDDVGANNASAPGNPGWSALPPRTRTFSAALSGRTRTATDIFSIAGAPRRSNVRM